jgi:branched-chain amino acid transport system substrate-binding protein
MRIGYSLSLTGPVAGNSRSAQVSHQIWQTNVNGRGGLLGRRVELVCIDDRADAAAIPEIYRKLLDDDGVDLVIGGYGTGNLMPAMPLIIERQRFFIGLMGLGVNSTFEYPSYFAMIPTGPDPNTALTEGFFAVAADQTPQPRTVALVAADAEFARNPVLGGRSNAARYGFEVIYEATYPLDTENFRPVIDDVAEHEPDLLFLCSYLSDSVELVRTIREGAFRPTLVGGAMIGPQNADVKTALGPLLNGIVNYEYWVPAQRMMFDGVQDLLDEYQARAGAEGVDALGFYMAPLAYAQLQVLAQAVEATGGLDDATLASYSRSVSFETVMGTVRFGRNGEWETSRVLQVQFQGITGHDADQFRSGASQVVVAPAEFASGPLRYPYSDLIEGDRLST